MNWRPKEGWDARQIVRQTLIHHWMAQDKEDTLTMTAIPPFYCALVEAGADAIVEALKAEGKQCILDVFSFRLGRELSPNAPQISTRDFGRLGDRGCLVFIPDEEEGC